MEVALLLAADYANVTNDGKLNVMGIFDSINAFNFPARHSKMHLVLRLVPEIGEFESPRRLTVKMVDADARNELMSISNDFDVPRPTGGIKPHINIILEVNDIIFPSPGMYQISVFIDKDFKKALPIIVNKIDTNKGS